MRTINVNRWAAYEEDPGLRYSIVHFGDEHEPALDSDILISLSREQGSEYDRKRRAICTGPIIFCRMASGGASEDVWVNGGVRRITLDHDRLFIELDPAISVPLIGESEFEVIFSHWRKNMPQDMARFSFPYKFREVCAELNYLLTGTDVFEDNVSASKSKKSPRKKK